MKKDRVIKPGKWWIVRFRRKESYEHVTGYMTCKNAYHAGHSGFKRKRRYVKGLGKRGPIRYVPRQWDLKSHSHRRLAYRFAELSDLKTSIRSKPVKEWMVKWDGILEIVEVEGCLYYGTVESRKVVERRFNTENEMEILAIECDLGDV